MRNNLKKIIQFFCSSAFVLLAIFPMKSHGETSSPVKIVSIRPITGASAGVVYFQVDQTALCGTTVFRIDLSVAGAKDLYAAVLSGFMAGVPMQIEVVTSGCTGWGSLVQSVTLIRS